MHICDEYSDYTAKGWEYAAKAMAERENDMRFHRRDWLPGFKPLTKEEQNRRYQAEQLRNIGGISHFGMSPPYRCNPYNSLFGGVFGAL